MALNSPPLMRLTLFPGCVSLLTFIYYLCLTHGMELGRYSKYKENPDSHPFPIYVRQQRTWEDFVNGLEQAREKDKDKAAHGCAKRRRIQESDDEERYPAL